MSLPASTAPAQQYLEFGKKATVPPTQRETASVGSVTQRLSVPVVVRSGYLPVPDTIFVSSHDTSARLHMHAFLRGRETGDTAGLDRNDTAPGKGPPGHQAATQPREAGACKCSRLLSLAGT